MKLLIKVSVTPSLNKLIRRVGWKVEAGYKKRYLKELSGYQFLAPKIPMRVILNVIRFGKRQLDQDNLTGSLKPLIDALKETGLIYRDDPKWLQINASQSFHKTDYPCCQIILEYLPAEEL